MTLAGVERDPGSGGPNVPVNQVPVGADVYDVPLGAWWLGPVTTTTLAHGGSVDIEIAGQTMVAVRVLPNFAAAGIVTWIVYHTIVSEGAVPAAMRVDDRTVTPTLTFSTSTPDDIWLLIPAAGFETIRLTYTRTSGTGDCVVEVRDTALSTVQYAIQAGTCLLGAGTAAIGKVGHDTTGVGDNTRTVTTAGTAVQLSTSSVPCKWVEITAYETNTGAIVIGTSTVVAASATRRGSRPLYAGDCERVPISNLNLLYIDATVSGEKVHYLYGS